MTPKKEYPASNGEVSVYFQNQKNRSPALAASAVAKYSEKDEVSLPDQLLRYYSDRSPNSAENIDSASVSSEEDRKPPAKPTYAPANSANFYKPSTNSINMGWNDLDSPPVFRSVSEPFNLTHPSKRVESSSDSATQPIVRSKLTQGRNDCARLLDDSQSSFYKATLEDLVEPDSYPRIVQDNSIEKDEQFARALSEQLANYSEPSAVKAQPDSKIRPISAKDGNHLENDTQFVSKLFSRHEEYPERSATKQSDVSSRQLEKDAELARTLSQQLEGNPVSSARGSNIDLDILPTLSTNDILEKDAQLAKELSQQLANPNTPQAPDDEFTRRLHTSVIDSSSINLDGDMALALNLLEETKSSINDTSSDEALAQKLSLELNAAEKSSDEMVARQICRQEDNYRPTVPEQCPEQLQILEKIQQDNERKLVEQALRESALSDLPIFQDETVVAEASLQRSNNTEQDYLNSQECALREWATAKSREHDGSPNTGSHENLLSGGYSRYHSSVESHSARINERNSSVPSVYRADYQVNHTMNSFGGNTKTGKASPNNAGSDESLARYQTNFGGEMHELHQNSNTIHAHSKQDQSYNHAKEEQDLMRNRAHVDLLQRGNDETRTAIEFGRSHVIICQGCHKRLHAPKYYSLVFCPNCDTISPGLAANHSGKNSSRPSSHHS
mmetsp:Transcript_1854/g.2556  ORF Transcript_1854/g.2556 Transcript_1854/m.2556 type:complete len:674 (-) Transcript_1854:79-2100(-)